MVSSSWHDSSVPANHAPPPRGPSNSFKTSLSHPVTFSPTHRPRKPFRCNTYVLPRKCCKQKTYGRAKSFRCNTYKNTGRGLQLSSEAVSPSGHSPFPCPLSPLFSYSCALFYTTALAQLFSSQSVTHSFHRDGGCTPLTASWISPLDANCHTVRPTLFSSLPRYLVTSLLRYLSARFARLLLHCSTHGSPTSRPTLPRRSPLARRDRARYSRLAAFHSSTSARRSALLDRNRFRTR